MKVFIIKKLKINKDINMKKIFFIISFFLFGLYFYADSKTPEVFFKGEIKLYIGMPVELIFEKLGKPEKSEIIPFTEEKSEYDEVWLHYDGVSVSYYVGKKELTRIIMSDSSSYVVLKEKEIRILQASIKDILVLFNKELVCVLDNGSVITFTYTQKEYYPGLHNELNLYFDTDGVLQKISLLDSIVFI
jgi:hypothetical protein